MCPDSDSVLSAFQNDGEEWTELSAPPNSDAFFCGWEFGYIATREVATLTVTQLEADDPQVDVGYWSSVPSVSVSDDDDVLRISYENDSGCRILHKEHRLMAIVEFSYTEQGGCYYPEAMLDLVLEANDLTPATTSTTTTAAPSTTVPVPADPLQDRYAAQLRQLGEELKTTLARFECEETSSETLDCWFWGEDGSVTQAVVTVQPDGTLTYEVEFAGGGM